MTEILRCPLCGESFSLWEKQLVCPHGHAFDLAKEGYVNLLTGSSPFHGDNPEMVKARRQFLEGGYYEPLALAVAEEICARLPSGGTVLDAGCGEGYYTRAIAQRAKGRVIAFDVSKDAVRLCAKRKCADAFVASSYAIPVKSSSVDAVACLFAPMAAEEFARVLKKGGYLIAAIPAKRHLWELKSVLYDTPYENQVSRGLLPEFAPPLWQNVTVPMELCDPQILGALFAMTPYYYRTPEKGRARLGALRSLSVTADFHILTYQKI